MGDGGEGGVVSGRFYPNRGKDAWPNGCPSCGEVVVAYLPVNEHNDYPTWEFDCGAEIYEGDGGIIEVFDDCPDAMSNHLNGVVITEDDEVEA